MPIPTARRTPWRTAISQQSSTSMTITGGEFYFTALDTVIKPKKGMFVGFTASFYHEHAVLRVEKSQRLTMPFFLTFDRGRADPSLL